jgi:hypothetical protein
MMVQCPFCTVDTAGQHEHNCPNTPHRAYGPPSVAQLTSVGWICPTCHRSISPVEKTCPFCPAMESTKQEGTVVHLVEKD